MGTTGRGMPPRTTSAGNRGCRHAGHGAAAVVAAAGMVLAGVQAAQADVPMQVTGSSVTTVTSDSTTALTGFSVSGTTGTLFVSLGTDRGALDLPAHTGLTLAYGYTQFSGSAFSFTGTETDVDTALAGLTLAPGAGAGTAHVSLAVAPQQDGLAYLPATGHYYQFVSAPAIAWTDAQTDAATHNFAGQTGYLAAIPTATVNDFITGKIEGASNVWFGAKAVDYPDDPDVQRIWSWTDGPLAGQVFTRCSNVEGACEHTGDDSVYDAWASGEPNNYDYFAGEGEGEHYAVTNWGEGSGEWNDLPDSTEDIDGYVVEFGDNETPFAGAASVTSDIAVTAQQAQGIVFPQPPAVSVSSLRATMRAGATSALPVTYTATRPTVCTITGATVTLRRAGLCTIVAHQAGNSSFLAAAAVSRTFRVAPAPALRAVPAHPWGTGPLRYTTALDRSRNGGVAAIAAYLTVDLQQSESAVLSDAALFGFDSAVLTTRGRAEVRALVARLDAASSVVCEGYTDYAGRAGHELLLSRARAQVVCAALRQYGAHVTVSSVGYGGSRPVVVGGYARQRAENRRVVVRVTGMARQG